MDETVQLPSSNLSFYTCGCTAHFYNQKGSFGRGSPKLPSFRQSSLWPETSEILGKVLGSDSTLVKQTKRKKLKHFISLINFLSFPPRNPPNNMEMIPGLPKTRAYLHPACEPLGCLVLVAR